MTNLPIPLVIFERDHLDEKVCDLILIVEVVTVNRGTFSPRENSDFWDFYWWHFYHEKEICCCGL